MSINLRRYLKSSCLLLLLFIILLLFTRFYNLDSTARFIWDESSDLVRMHQFYVEKMITLVGPINESGTRVYSSLTYYILLPFAIIGKFDPVSPVWGTAFFGIITALLLIFLTSKLNPRYTILVAILTLVWFPLIETSRWAWNPNLIPLWSTLAVIFFLKKTPVFIYLSGICFGLTVHHHYLSLFSLLGFLVGLFQMSIKERKFFKPLILSLGILTTLLPFVIFDIRHPPGLFLTRILYASPLDTSFSVFGMLNKAFVWFQYMLNYYTQSPILSLGLGLSTLLLLALDARAHSKGLLFALPWITQLIGLVFIQNPGPIYYYYFLPSTILFLIWILYPRQNNQVVANIILSILLIGGFFSIIPKISQTNWQTDIKSVKKINSIISNEINTKNLQNINIAVLESPDNNTYGRRYRDLLLLQNIHLKTKDEYGITDNLFVVSTGSENSLRVSPAYEMHNFRYGLLESSWRVYDSNWKVYYFTRNISK